MTKFGMVVLSMVVPATAFAQQAAEKKAPPPPAAAAAAPAMPAPPPEAKATVDAFKGTWHFDGTITATGMPGFDKPFNFKFTYTCKSVVGGAAAECTASKVKTPMGPWEAMFVIAYNPYDKAVHFMGFDNGNEVHDHTCKWSGTSMTCTPLKGGMGPGGDEVTEDITMNWVADKKCTANDSTCLAGAKAVSFTSKSVMTKSGATMTFEGKGKR